MNKLIKKLVSIETTISQDIGGFNLFALVEREDITGKYDLLVSIKLKKMSKNGLFRVIHENFIEEMQDDELLMFSRFVYLLPTEPFVQNINSLVEMQHGNFEVRNTSINGLQIKHAVIISSSRDSQIQAMEISNTSHIVK